MNDKLALLRECLLRAPIHEQVQIAIEFLNKIDGKEVFTYLYELCKSEPFSLAYKLILSPPHVLPLLTFSDFSVEVIHWLYSNDPDMKADNEDIHDHFETIVSVALKGDPYKCIDFCKNKNGDFAIENEFIFKEGAIHIIRPETIHKVVMQPGQSAISLRILLPANRTTSYVYDENGNVIRNIENSMLVRQRAINQMLDVLI
ncbi:hypothetical protein [Microcoleus sp. herbarium5]|uniref:hypothetical protein n=1 Tax=Microcoleus sp. herbarium5 TaxID=3055434 RepID=UPI002FCF04D0